MLRRIGLPAGLAGLALAFSACGSDLPTGTNSGDKLASAEVQELVNEFFDLIFSMQLDIPGLNGQLTNPALSLSTVSTPINDSYSSTDACESGGTSSVSATVNGSYDDQAGTGNAKIEGTVDFSQCMFTGQQATYTIDGDPEIGVTADLTISQTSATLDFKLGGGFAFDAGDKSGTCSVDFSVKVTATSTGGTVTASGNVCDINANGLNINFEF
jgi:hypothetical protein